MNDRKEAKEKFSQFIQKSNDKQKGSAKSVTSKQSVKFISEMGLDKQKKTEASSTDAQSETQSSRVQQRKGTTTTVTTYVGTVNKRIQSEHKLPPLPPNLLPGGGYSPASLLKAKEKFVQEQKMIQKKQLEKQQRKEKQQQEKKQQVEQQQSPIKSDQQFVGDQQMIQEIRYQNNPLLQSELGQINEQETYQSHSDRSYTISDPAQTPPVSQRCEELQAQYSASEQFKTEESPKQQFTENLPTINEKSESQLQTSPRVQPKNPNIQDVQTSKFQVDIESSQSQSEPENVKVEITQQQIIVQQSQSEEVIIEQVIIEQVIQNTQIDQDQQSIGQSIYKSLITKVIVQQQGEEKQIEQQDMVETQTTQINVIQQVQNIATENIVEQVIKIQEGDQQIQQQSLQEQENLITDIQNIQQHSNESDNKDQTQTQDDIKQEEQQNTLGQPVKDVDKIEKQDQAASQNEEPQDQDQFNRSDDKQDKNETSQIDNQDKSGIEIGQQNEDLLKEQLKENQQQIENDNQNSNQNKTENSQENEQKEQSEQKEGNQQMEEKQQSEQKGDYEQVGNEAKEDNYQIRETNQMQQGAGQEPFSVGEGQDKSIGNQEVDHQNIIQQQVIQPQDDEQIVGQEQLSSVEQLQQQQNTLLQQGPDDQELGNPIGINQDQTIQIQGQQSIDNAQFQQEDQLNKTDILDKNDDKIKQTAKQQDVQEVQVQQKIEEIQQNIIKEENQQQDDNTQGQQQLSEISNLGDPLGGQSIKNEDNQEIPQTDQHIQEKQQEQDQIGNLENEQEVQFLGQQEDQSHNDLNEQEQNSLKQEKSEDPTDKQNFEENQQEFKQSQGPNQNAQEQTNLDQIQNQDEISEREASQKNSGNQLEDSLKQQQSGPILVKEYSYSKIIFKPQQSEPSQQEIVIQDGQLEKKENKDENENEIQKIDEHIMQNVKDTKIVKEENQQKKLSDEGALKDPLGNKSDEDEKSLNDPLGNKSDEESFHKSLDNQAVSDEKSLNDPLGNRSEEESFHKSLDNQAGQNEEQLNDPLGNKADEESLHQSLDNQAESDEKSLNDPLGKKSDEESFHKSLDNQAGENEEQLNDPLGNKSDEESFHKSLDNQAESDEKSLNDPLGNKSEEESFHKSLDNQAGQNEEQLNDPLGNKADEESLHQSLDNQAESDEKSLNDPLGKKSDEESFHKSLDNQAGQNEEQLNDPLGNKADEESQHQSLVDQAESDEKSLNDPLGNKADEESLHQSLDDQAGQNEEQLNDPLGNKPSADSDEEQLNNPLGRSVEGQLNKSQDYMKSQNNQQLNEEQNAQEAEWQQNQSTPLLDQNNEQQIAQMNRLQQQQSIQSSSQQSRMVVSATDEIIETPVIIRSNTIQEITKTSIIRSLEFRSNSMGQNDLINSPEGSSQEDQTSIMKNLVNRSQEIFSYQQIEVQQMVELQFDQVDEQQIEQINEEVIIVKEHKLTQLEQEIQQFDVQLDQDSSLQFILDIKRLDKTELEKLFKETQDVEKKSVIKHLLKLNQEKENEALDFIKNDINYTSEYEDAFKSNIIELLLTLDEVLEEIQDLKQESLDNVVGRVTLRQTQKFINRIPKMVDDQIELYKQKLQEQIEQIQNLNQESLNDPILNIIYNKVRQNQEKQQAIDQLNDQCQKQLKLIEELQQQLKVQEEILQQKELIIKSIPPQKNDPQEQNQLNTMDIGILFDWSSKQEVVDDQNLKEFLEKFNAYKHKQFDKFRIQQDFSLNQLFEKYQNKDQQLQYVYSQLTQTRLINNFDDVSEANIKEYFAVLLKFKEFLFEEEQHADHHSSIQEIIKRRELQLITEKQKYGDNQVILMKIFQQISQAQILSNYQKVDEHNYEEFFIALFRFKQLTFEQYNRAIRENQEQNHQGKMLEKDQSQNVSLEQLSQTLIKKYDDVQEKYQTLSQNQQQPQQEVIDVITVDDEIITKYEQIQQNRKQLEEKLQDQLDQIKVQKQEIESLKAQIEQQGKVNEELQDKIEKFNQILGDNDQNVDEILKDKQEICELIKAQQNVQLQKFLQLVKKEITSLRKSQQEHPPAPIQKEQESQINEDEINSQQNYIENQLSQDQSVDKDLKSTEDKKESDKKERELLQNYIQQLKDEVENLKQNISQLLTDNAELKNQLEQESSKNAIMVSNQEENQIKRDNVSENPNQGIKQVQEPPQFNDEGNQRDNLLREIAQLVEENNLLKQELQQLSQNMESEKLKYQQSQDIIEDSNKKLEKQKEDIDQQEELVTQLIKQSKLLQQEHHDNIQELLAKQKVEIQKIQDIAEQKEIETRNLIEKYWTDQFQDQNIFQEQDYSKNSVIQTINESFSKQFKQTLTQSNIHEDITIMQLIWRYNEIRSYIKKILQENFKADNKDASPKIKQQQESIGEQLEYVSKKIQQLMKEKQETEQSLTDKINNLVEERNEDAQKIDFLEQQLIDYKQKYDDQPSEPHTQRISVSDHNLEELNDVTLIDKVIQDLKKINYFDLTVNQEDQYKDFIDGFLIQKMEMFKKYEIEENLSINQVLQRVQQYQRNPLIEQLKKTKYFKDVDARNVQEKIKQLQQEEQNFANISYKIEDWHENDVDIISSINSLKNNNIRKALTYLTSQLDQKNKQSQPIEKVQQHDSDSYKHLINQLHQIEQDLQSITKREMVQEPLDSSKYLKPGINPKYYVLENLRIGFQMLKEKVQSKIQFYKFDQIQSFEGLVDQIVEILLFNLQQVNQLKYQLEQERQNSKQTESKISEEHLKAITDMMDIREFLQFNFKSEQKLSIDKALKNIQGLCNHYFSKESQKIKEVFKLYMFGKSKKEIRIMIYKEEDEKQIEIKAPIDKMDNLLLALRSLTLDIYKDLVVLRDNNGKKSEFKSSVFQEVQTIIEKRYQIQQQNEVVENKIQKIEIKIEQNQNKSEEIQNEIKELQNQLNKISEEKRINEEKFKQVELEYQQQIHQLKEQIQILNLNINQILQVNAETLIFDINQGPQNEKYQIYQKLYAHFKNTYINILQYHENEINKINVVALDDYLQNENQLVSSVIKKLQISQELLKQQVASDYYYLLDNLQPFEELDDKDPLKEKLCLVFRKYRKEYDMKYVELKEFQSWLQKITIQDFKDGKYQPLVQKQLQDIQKIRFIEIIQSLISQYDKDMIEWLKELQFNTGIQDQYREIHKIFMEKFSQFYFDRLASQDKIQLIRNKDGVQIETFVPVRYLQTGDYNVKMKQLIQLAQEQGQDVVNFYIDLYNKLKQIMKSEQFEEDIQKNGVLFIQLVNEFQSKQVQIYNNIKKDSKFEEQFSFVQNLLLLTKLAGQKLGSVLNKHIFIIEESTKELYQLNPLTRERALQIK